MKKKVKAGSRASAPVLPRSVEVADPAAELARVTAEQERRELARYRHRPLDYTLAAYPWGQAGTELANEPGPRDWQRAQLARIQEQLLQAAAGAGVASIIIREATSSGHGIGKSASVAWLALWALDTMPDARVVVTANTGGQLKTKTWPEISKWFRLNRFMPGRFAKSAESIQADARPDTWRLDRMTWTKENAEAYQGLHNKGKRLVMLMDEASAIHPAIWSATEGALTDEGTEMVWAVYGNPTRKDGRFHACFNEHRHLWRTQQIDARTIPGTNKALFEEWRSTWGEDSDYFRVKVKGEFPRASAQQWIDSEAIAQAARRPAPDVRATREYPIIMGIDVARGGSANFVVRMRQGMNARGWPVVRVPGSEARDSMKMAALVAEKIRFLKPDAIFMDTTGVGGPVADRLRQLGYNVLDVQGAAASPDPACGNMRMYMWKRLRDAIERGGLAIDDDPLLKADLEGPEYYHNAKDQLMLESKDDMAARGLASPDDGDALGFTFAEELPMRDVDPYTGAVATSTARGRVGHAASEYDPLERAEEDAEERG